jgi:hypothetical protein
VEFSYTISLEEFAEASTLSRMSTDKRWRDLVMTSWRGVVVLLLVFAFSLTISQIRGWGQAWIISTMVILYALIMIHLNIICPRLVRGGYEKQKSGFNFRVWIDEMGVTGERSDATAAGRHLWGAFHGYLEGERTFVLYLNQYKFVIIPKRAMTSEQCNELRVLLGAHLPLKGFSAWKSQSAAS